MSGAQLSVLTDPMPEGTWLPGEYARRVARRVRDYFRPPPPHTRSGFRGHAAVTRSLVEGLAKIGVTCVYNPQVWSDLADVAVVLANLRALGQTIQWKRRGRIKRLLAGPNLMDLPSDNLELASAPEIDVWLANSAWKAEAHVADCGVLRTRCAIWSAGVDTKFWSPTSPDRQRRVVVFDKLGGKKAGLLDDVLAAVARSGLEAVLVRYGGYTSLSYRSELRRAEALVGLSECESQCLAWAEAWAVGVPTLVYARDHLVYKGRRVPCSAAPYLTPETGAFFSTVEELEGLLSDASAAWRRGHPRQWVLQNMSDEVCAEAFCRIAGIPVVSSLGTSSRGTGPE